MIGVLYWSVRTVTIPIAVRTKNLNLAWDLVILFDLNWLKYSQAISPIPGITKKTGIVKAGFREYLKEDLSIGNPPTDAMRKNKNKMPIKVKQNPIE